MGNALRNMKEKIIAAIKAKFPAVNLGKKRLDAIAAKLESKVTDESQIDAQIDAFNDFNSIADIAKNDDKVRDLEAKLKLATPEKKTDTVEEPEVSADTPAWAKALIESNKTLSSKLAQIEGEKSQQTIKQKIAEQLKGKDGKDSIPEALWNKRQLPQKDEEIEAFITDVKADHATIAQSYTNHQLGQSSRPPGSQSNSATAKIHTDVQKFIDQQKARQESAPVKTATATV